MSNEPIDMEYTIGETPGALPLLPADDPAVAIVPKTTWHTLRARIAALEQAANDGAAKIAELHSYAWELEQQLHVKECALADAERALEMEHQLLGEARLQIEDKDKHIADLLQAHAEYKSDAIAAVRRAEQAEEAHEGAAILARAERNQWIAEHQRIAEQQSLLSQCLAALVCMSGEYHNEPLIEAVRGALAERGKA